MNYDECIWVGEVRERPKTTYVRKKLGVDWFFSFYQAIVW